MNTFNQQEYEEKLKLYTKNQNIYADKYVTLRAYLIANFDSIKKIYSEDDYLEILINYVIIYGDEARYLVHEYNFINDSDKWDIEKIQASQEKEEFKKIFNYYEKAIECIKIISNYKDIKEKYPKFSSIYLSLATLCYAIDDIDKFKEYAEKAVSYSSLSAARFLTKYYTDNDDYANAFKYYELCNNVDINDLSPANYQKIKIKIGCNAIMYSYLFSKGKYESALIVNNNLQLMIDSIIKKNEEQFPLSEELTPYEKHQLEAKENLYQTFLTRKKECEARIAETKIASKEDKLNKYFKQNIIDLMNNDVKIYISTTINIYDYLIKSPMRLDYSAALIPIMKGVENILYNIFAKHYLKYLKSIDNIDYKQISENFKIYDETTNTYSIKENIAEVTYGDAIYSIGKYNSYSDNWKIKEYFKDFYLSHKENNNFYKDMNDFLNKLRKLKNQRNRTAHNYRVIESDATECIKDLIQEQINFITMLYTYFDFCFKD